MSLILSGEYILIETGNYDLTTYSGRTKIPKDAYDDDGIDFTKILCSVCHWGESTDVSDAILAFHINVPKY